RTGPRGGVGGAGRGHAGVAAGIDGADHDVGSGRQGRRAGDEAARVTLSLEAHLRSRRDAGHKLLVPYITGGLGSQWTTVLRAVAAAGADAVEIGIPFSDPVMDGPTIQEASQRALGLGATPAGILADVRSEAAEVDVRLA